MSFPDEYVAWDLETSGLDAESDRILEIGAVHWKGEDIVAQKNWLLKHPGFVVPGKIEEITGITQAMIDEEGVDPKSAIDEFIQWFEPVEWHNLTHNGFRFDIPFLLNALVRESTFDYSEREVIKKEMYSKGRDSAVLYKARSLGLEQNDGEGFPVFARRVLDIKAYGVKYNVAHCCTQLKIDTSNMRMHRALGDVHLTNQIFKKLTV